MAEDEAPPVVAVVVASDPGPWFDECLTALGAQDYPNLSVLVVDAGCADDPAPRVAAVLPKAYLRRVASNPGFGAAANEVLGAVSGASHLLLCHDDVAPAPDAVRRMVEEAFRSNAGIVTPKYVSWNEPDWLLQVGMGADRFGSPVPRVEAGEIDQAQHDEVREVFAAPGGCTLVRSDLFETLGGFDREIILLGEDIDLSWRAQNAGARVVVAPSAAVRHLEATAGGVRQRPDRRALQRRHELRAVLKNYGLPYRCAVVSQMVVLALLEVAYCLVIDDRGRAREVISAWRWNLAPGRGLRRARRQARSTRRLPDRVVAQLRAPARRPRNFLLRRAEEATVGPVGRFPAHGARARLARATARPSRRQAEAIGVAAVLLVVAVFGLRDLITGPLPVVGGYAPFPHATSLLAKFFTGWTAQGVQHRSPPTPAFGALGAAGLLLGGAMGFLYKLVLLGSIALGAIGAARLVGVFGSTRARLVAAAAYLLLPLAWNDVAKGDLPALVVYATTPFILVRLTRAMGAPGGMVPPQTFAPPSLAREVAALGLVLAITGSFAPSVVLATGVAAAAMCVGSLLAGDFRATGRLITVAVGSCMVAFLVTLPWSISFLGSGRTLSAFAGALGAPGTAPSLGDLMRFDIGPIGRGLFGWGILAAATLPLMIGRGVRFRNATRWWSVVFASFALAWAGVEGWLGAGGGATGVFLAPAAAALAGCVALGVVAFEQDLPSYSFGWRQAVTGAAAVCAAAGAIPFLVATTGGRFSVPGTGYEQVLGYLTPAHTPDVPYRVLWLGDPGALPLRGWQVAPGYAVALSENGLPDATGGWPAASPGAATRVTAAVELARHGLTVDLGSLLSGFGVRYIVVPTASAPVLTGVQSATSLPPPPGLLAGLTLQSDLRELSAQAGSTVFVNAAWAPGDGPAPLPGEADPPLSALAGGPAAALEMLLFLAVLVVAVRRPRRRDRVALSSSAAVGRPAAPLVDEQVASADGEAPPPEPAIAGSRPAGGVRKTGPLRADPAHRSLTSAPDSLVDAVTTPSGEATPPAGAEPAQAAEVTPQHEEPAVAALAEVGETIEVRPAAGASTTMADDHGAEPVVEAAPVPKARRKAKARPAPAVATSSPEVAGDRPADPPVEATPAPAGPGGPTTPPATDDEVAAPGPVVAAEPKPSRARGSSGVRKAPKEKPPAVEARPEVEVPGPPAAQAQAGGGPAVDGHPKRAPRAGIRRSPGAGADAAEPAPAPAKPKRVSKKAAVEAAAGEPVED